MMKILIFCLFLATVSFADTTPVPGFNTWSQCAAGCPNWCSEAGKGPGDLSDPKCGCDSFCGPYCSSCSTKAKNSSLAWHHRTQLFSDANCTTPKGDLIVYDRQLDTCVDPNHFGNGATSECVEPNVVREKLFRPNGNCTDKIEEFDYHRGKCTHVKVPLPSGVTLTVYGILWWENTCYQPNPEDTWHRRTQVYEDPECKTPKGDIVASDNQLETCTPNAFGLDALSTCVEPNVIRTKMCKPHENCANKVSEVVFRRGECTQTHIPAPSGNVTIYSKVWWEGACYQGAATTTTKAATSSPSSFAGLQIMMTIFSIFILVTL